MTATRTAATPTRRRRAVVVDAESYAAPPGLDADVAYRALTARDARFDGHIWVGVTSTGIYCRPVCPAQTPRREHVRFFVAPAAAVTAGFRACKRCRPDAQPGTRQWDHRGDLVGRALRLIGDGAVDDGGVAGLARTLHVSERHLHRMLVAEVGAAPLQLALSRRAQTARMLVDQTAMPLTDVAFAAGFSSVRQFNDVMRREFGVAPTQLRRSQAPELRADTPSLLLRLRVRPPYDAAAIGDFLAARTVPGLERHAAPSEAAGRNRPVEGWWHERPVPLPGGAAVVTVAAGVVDTDHVTLRARHGELRDTAQLVAHVRRWLDLDADPSVIADVLVADAALAPLISARPGLRVPTTVDAWETCVRAVVGQQVSVAGARTLVGRLVAAYGVPLEGLTRFPAPGALAAAGPEALAAIGMPQRRGHTLHALAAAVAEGGLDLTALREDALDVLATLPGIGPWTRDYVALRAFADPDAFPVTDLGVRRTAARLGLPTEPRALTVHAHRWRPWRAYAAQHLWTSTMETP